MICVMYYCDKICAITLLTGIGVTPDDLQVAKCVRDIQLTIVGSILGSIEVLRSWLMRSLGSCLDIILLLRTRREGTY